MARRIERVNKLIRQEISELLQRNLKDPRFSQLVAVNEVETTPDIRHARIFVSCVCNEKEKQEIMSALASASGFLRGELSKRLKMRHVPELSFYWDESIERGARILELIDRVKTEKERQG